MKHKYADILNAIAEGQQIQFLSDHGWEDQDGSTTLVEIVEEFFEPSQYRVKPKTIKIGDYEVPKPISKLLEYDQDYWFVDITNPTLASKTAWNDHEFDRRMLKFGLIHLTREDAETHAQAFIDITKDAQNAN